MSEIQTSSELLHNDPARESRVKDFFELLKPRVMSLVVFSGFAGMFVAPGYETMHPLLAVVAMLCLAVGAGASGAVNMWFDRDIDAVMKRTKQRPLPQGRVQPDDALAFAVILSLFSVMIMGLAVNWMAASILAFAIFFYVFVYTAVLKRSTPQNIVIGGAAGAFPPMVGWAAVTGGVSWESLVLFAIIFLWTPPHFWALSLYANEDYKKAEIPMMTVVAGPKSTKIQMQLYTLVLFPVTLMPYFMGIAGTGYLWMSVALSGFFIFTSIRVLFDKTMKSAKLMFMYSVFYLFALFLAMMINAT